MSPEKVVSTASLCLLALIVAVQPGCVDTEQRPTQQRNDTVAPLPPGAPIDQVEAATSSAGHLGWTTGVSDRGALNAAIEFRSAPGVGGMQPSLGLSYDSSRGTGDLGKGWSLSGTGGAISRCTWSKGERGQTQPVTLSIDDGICLNGQHLLQVDGALGADGAEYRLRNNNHTRVIQHGALDQENCWFEVQYPDGSRSHYGSTDPSRISGFGADGTLQTHTWTLERETDRNSNYISYNYASEWTASAYSPNRAGETSHRLTSIEYGGNLDLGKPHTRRVEIVYVDRTAKNESHGWFAGIPTAATKRVSRVHMYATGPTPFLTYLLAYEPTEENPSGSLLLRSVQECTGFGELSSGDICKPETYFEWEKQEVGFEEDPDHPVNALAQSQTDVLNYFLPPAGHDTDFDRAGDGYYKLWGWANNAVEAYAFRSLFADTDGDGALEYLWLPGLDIDYSGNFRAFDDDGNLVRKTNNALRSMKLGPNLGLDPNSGRYRFIEDAFYRVPHHADANEFVATSGPPSSGMPAIVPTAMRHSNDEYAEVILPMGLGNWGVGSVDTTVTGVTRWDPQEGINWAYGFRVWGERLPSDNSDGSQHVIEYDFRRSDPDHSEVIYAYQVLDANRDGLDDVLYCAYDPLEAYDGSDYNPLDALPVWKVALNDYDTERLDFSNPVVTDRYCSAWDRYLQLDDDGDGSPNFLLSRRFDDVAGVPHVMVPSADWENYFSLRLERNTTGVGPDWIAAWVDTGLPADRYQRWRIARGGHSGDNLHNGYLSDIPQYGQGPSMDKIADIDGDGLQDILRWELAAGDGPENLEDIHATLYGFWCAAGGSSCDNQDFPEWTGTTETSGVRVWINTGSGFIRGPMLFSRDRHLQEAYRKWLRTIVVDTDLDGRVELLHPRIDLTGIDQLARPFALTSFGPNLDSESDDETTVLTGQSNYEYNWETPVGGLDRKAFQTGVDYDDDGLADLLYLGDTAPYAETNAQNLRFWRHRHGVGDVLKYISTPGLSVTGFEYRLLRNAQRTESWNDGWPRPGRSIEDRAEKRIVVHQIRDDHFPLSESRIFRYGATGYDPSGHGHLGFTEVQEWRGSSENSPYEVRTIRFDPDSYSGSVGTEHEYEGANRVSETFTERVYINHNDQPVHRYDAVKYSYDDIYTNTLVPGQILRETRMVSKTEATWDEPRSCAPEPGHAGPGFCTDDLPDDSPFGLDEWMLLTFVENYYEDPDQFGNFRLQTERSLGAKIGEPSSDIGDLITTEREFDNDEANWQLGRVRREVLRSIPGEFSGDIDQFGTREVDNYFDARGNLSFSEAQANSDPSEFVRSDFSYDGFGNVTSIEVQDGAGALRSQTMAYTEDGVFPLWQENALGHRTRYRFDERFGTPQVVLDPNGISHVSLGDLFGRPSFSGTFNHLDAPRGDEVRWTYEYLPGSARYKITERQRVGTGPVVARGVADPLYRTSERFLELSGFEVESRTDGPLGERIVQTMGYDSRGRLVTQTLPYFEGQSPAGSVTYGYDNLDRVTTKSAPDSGTQRVEHYGLDERIFDADGRYRDLEYDGAGRLRKVIEKDGNGGYRHICLSYGFFGQLTEYTRGCEPGASHSLTTTLSHRSDGALLEMNDPQFGVRTFEHNGLGELVSASDSSGQFRVYERDSLGRVERRIDSDGISSWSYDSSLVGYESGSVSSDGIVSAVEYDSFGRAREQSWVVGGSFYDAQFYYDSASNLKTVIYPEAFGHRQSVRYDYDGAGFQVGVRDLLTGDSLWQLEETDAYGGVTSELFANGTRTVRDFDRAGRLAYQETRESGGGLIQLEDYVWSDAGNLEERADLLNSQIEILQYDTAGRLGRSTSTGPDQLSRVVDVQYDNLGNITNKSFVGPYNYSTSSGAQLRSAGGDTFYYDDAGRLTSRVGQSGSLGLSYTALGKVASMTQPGETVEFYYSADGSRARRVNLADDVRWLDGLFEHRIDSGGSERAVSRVYAGGREVAQLAAIDDFGNVTRQVEYIHVDHLGSTVMVTDDYGMQHRMAYDAWGAKRDPYDWSLDAEFVKNVAAVPGFTGHPEELDAGLTYMQARNYDARIGRFMSADDIVPDPTRVEAYNRFSYVYNNPLSLVDPDGHQPAQGSSDSQESGGICRKNSIAMICGGGGGGGGGKDPGPGTGTMGAAIVSSVNAGTPAASNAPSSADFGQAENQGPGVGERIINQTLDIYTLGATAQFRGYVETGRFGYGVYRQTLSMSRNEAMLAVTGGLGAELLKVEGGLVGGAMLRELDAYKPPSQLNLATRMLTDQVVLAVLLKRLPSISVLRRWSKGSGGSWLLRWWRSRVAKGGGGYPSSRILHRTPRNLQKFFTKHGDDFGLAGNWNASRAAEASEAIHRHINSPAVRQISGTYRGNPVTHHLDPKTGLNVIEDAGGNFVSGWKLGAEQLQSVLSSGRLF